MPAQGLSTRLLTAGIPADLYIRDCDKSFRRHAKKTRAV